MVLLKTYRRVEMPLDQLPWTYRSGSDPDWGAIRSGLSAGNIKNFVIYAEGGTVRCQNGSLSRPMANVEWQIPPEKRDYFASYLAGEVSSYAEKKSGLEEIKSALWFTRTLDIGGRDFSYEVHYDNKGKAIKVKLPQQIVTAASGAQVTGYVYGRNFSEERQRLFDETLLPLEKDARKMGFARKVTRFSEKCMTTLCFEPMEMDQPKLAKLIRGSMETEDVQTNYEFEKTEKYQVGRSTRWHLSVEDPATMRAVFFGNEDDSHVKIRGLRFMGFEIPPKSSVHYEESYATWLGRKVDSTANKFFDSIDYLKRFEPGFVDSVRKKASERREARDRKEKEKAEKMEAWLKKYAPSPNAESNDGCIIIVDPVCEMKVMEGTDPLEKEPAINS